MNNVERHISFTQREILQKPGIFVLYNINTDGWYYWNKTCLCTYKNIQNYFQRLFCILTDFTEKKTENKMWAPNKILFLYGMKFQDTNRFLFNILQASEWCWIWHVFYFPQQQIAGTIPGYNAQSIEHMM